MFNHHSPGQSGKALQVVDGTRIVCEEVDIVHCRIDGSVVKGSVDHDLPCGADGRTPYAMCRVNGDGGI